MRRLIALSLLALLSLSLASCGHCPADWKGPRAMCSD